MLSQPFAGSRVNLKNKLHIHTHTHTQTEQQLARTSLHTYREAEDSSRARISIRRRKCRSSVAIFSLSAVTFKRVFPFALVAGLLWPSTSWATWHKSYFLIKSRYIYVYLDATSPRIWKRVDLQGISRCHAKEILPVQSFAARENLICILSWIRRDRRFDAAHVPGKWV